MSLATWTEDSIKAILAVCDRATKGAWRYDEQADLILGDNDQAIVLEPRHGCKKGKANAEFAVMARDVLPSVLRALLSARGELNALRVVLDLMVKGDLRTDPGDPMPWRTPRLHYDQHETLGRALRALKHPKEAEVLEPT